MKKILLTGILVNTIVSIAQAEICPPGPADCIKSSSNHVTCTVVGNDGVWRFYEVMPNLPTANVHYSFTFLDAHSRITKVPVPADSDCVYADLTTQQPYVAVFRPRIPLLPDMKLGSLWTTPTTFGTTTCTSPPVGYCRFQWAKE